MSTGSHIKQTQYPSVRVVTVGEDGAIQSSRGMSLTAAAERMKTEGTISPRIFLSMEAERLIRSFNSDSVYSLPVRIQRSGFSTSDTFDRGDRWKERETVNTLTKNYSRHLSKDHDDVIDMYGAGTSFPPPETKSSSISAWRVSSTQQNIPQSEQTRAFNLPSPIMKVPPPVMLNPNSSSTSPTSSGIFDQPLPQYTLSHDFSDPRIGNMSASANSSPPPGPISHITSPKVSTLSSISPPPPVALSTSSGVTLCSSSAPRVSELFHKTSLSDDVFHILPENSQTIKLSPLTLSQFPSQPSSSSINDVSAVKENSESPMINYSSPDKNDDPKEVSNDSSEVNDLDLENVIQFKLEEIVPERQDAPKIIPTFRPETSQTIKLSPLTLSQFPSQPSTFLINDVSVVKENSEHPVITYSSLDKNDDPKKASDDSSEVNDLDLDNFIQSKLEELVPERQDAPKIKPTFLPPTKQSKLTNYFPDRRSQSSFKPPLKKDLVPVFKNIELATNKEGDVTKIKGKHKIERELQGREINTKKFKVNEGNLFIMNDDNKDEAEELLFGCKELVFLIVFREGFTQLRDTTALGTDFGSPMGVVIRMEPKEGEVKFIRIELWSKSCSAEMRDIFWNSFILHPTARKLVYDGKAFLNSLMGVLPPSTIIPLSLRLVDPIVGCWLLNPDQPVSSFSACVKTILPSKTLSSPGSDNTAVMHSEMDLLSLLCRELYHHLEKVNLWGLFYQLEMRILPILVSMERRGVCVERSKLEKLSTILDKELKELQGKANKMAGKEFNLNSPKQVRKVLYEDLKVDQNAGAVVGKTAGGVKSTCEAVLAKLVNFHPLPNIILQHRHVAKYKTTYVEGILSHCKMGKVFTIWDQVAAATGRITSLSPNLQALPKGDIDIGCTAINLRSPIIPTEGFLFLAADFEQIEFRIFGHLSQDFHLLSAIKEGGDIFKKLAAIWLEKTVENVSEDDRDKTKKVVYSLMYGAGKMRLSEILSITVPQATAIINSFYTKFSSLKAFNRCVIAKAEKNGFLTTLFGRRRYFPHISSINQTLKAQAQRQAFNFLIQGSAADVVKSALLRTEESLEVERVEAKLVMTIHDEMAWEVREKDITTAAEIVKKSLEDTREVKGMDGKSRRLEMKAKVSCGSNWGSLSVVQ